MASIQTSKSFSSACSLSSPGSPSSPPSPITPNLLEKKSMEEVWKDISLANLNDAPSASAAATVMISTAANEIPSFHGMILQEYLAKPRGKELPRRLGAVNNGASLAEETDLFSSLPIAPATILSLNFGSTGFQYIGSGRDPVVKPNPAAVNARADGAAVETPSFPACVCRKRGCQENNGNSDHNRRHKRMMKNRESAARSRARRQAYTYELELEVANLLKENANLRRQQEELLDAPLKLPKKNTLTRTLTAPF